MLRGLLFLGILGFGAIKESRDNAKCMSKPSGKIGNYSYYRDRKSRMYINKEKVHVEVEHDKYGNSHTYTIGDKTGKVYNDSFNDFMKRMDKENKEERARSIKNGKLAYNKYDPRFKKSVTTEVGSEKIIVCLYMNTVKDIKGNQNVVYRKFYLTNPDPGVYDYKTITPGDLGVIISKQEFNRLHILLGTFSNIPSDPNVIKKLNQIDRIV